MSSRSPVSTPNITGSRKAIIDIGSNSIRLVVFGGPPRTPAVLFNEKLMAGLGRGVVATGQLDADAVKVALAGLARFAALVELLGPVPVRVVATAAVREASNGAEFLGRVRALGLPAEILSGDAEATAAGHGVISGAPGAEGLVADMGGGSLELVRVAGGQVGERISLPLGALRVAEIRASGMGKLRKRLRELLTPLDWLHDCKDLYLVGGSWRALARLHMAQTGWPLPILGNYSFPAGDARTLKADVRALGSARLAAMPGVKANRVPQLDDAAALLVALVAELSPDRVVISAHGLREGLLYEALDPATRALDPLIEGVRHAVGAACAPGAAEALLGWSDPLFEGEPSGHHRLRHAAYLLSETGWTSNPDFRVIEGEDLALHGNWSGVDGEGRALMAMAQHVGLGGDPARAPAILARLASYQALSAAAGWGHAMRLARRLTGNNQAALGAFPLRIAEDGAIMLGLPGRMTALVNAGTERRLVQLAMVSGREARVEVLP